MPLFGDAVQATDPLPPSPNDPTRSTRYGHWKAGVKKSPGKVGMSMTERIEDKLQTYIRCNTLCAWDTFEDVNVSPDLNTTVNDECGAVGKEESGVWFVTSDWYSRLDFDVRRSPLPDKLLTTLHNLRIPYPLVSQPCPERTTETIAESITIECGWHGRSSEEEKGAKGEDGCERREGRAGGGIVVIVVAEERKEKHGEVTEWRRGPQREDRMWTPFGIPHVHPCYDDSLNRQTAWVGRYPSRYSIAKCRDGGEGGLVPTIALCRIDTSE